MTIPAPAPAPATRMLSVSLKAGQYRMLRDSAGRSRRTMSGEARAAIAAHLRDHMIGRRIWPVTERIFVVDEGGGP